jgi:translocation and assembly module TamA
MALLAGITSTISPDLTGASAPLRRLPPVTGRAVVDARRLSGVLALCLLATLHAPSLAQDLDAAPELEELIPDAAVEDAEGWASQGADAGETVTPEDLAVDPAATRELDEMEAALRIAPIDEGVLASLPDPATIELPPVEPLEQGEEIEFATFEDVVPPLPEGTEIRVSNELVLVLPTEDALFPVRGEFVARFKDLSVVRDLADDGNQARLSAQARADEELLERMLRVYGYFDGQVIRSVVPAEDREGADDRPATARFDVIPGRRYTVGEVELGQLDQTGSEYDALRASYPVQSGDLLSIDAIADGRYKLDLELGERGYPFATIAEPSLLVDHARQEGDVTLPVTPGGRYAFGRVVSNMEDFLSSEHLNEIARFDTGDIYQRSLEMDLRRAIQATGLVGSTTITPVAVSEPDGETPGTVDIAVDMTRAPLRTIAGSIGYGTDEGFRLAGSWEHRNLFPPEGMLRVRGIAGTQEQLLGVTFRKNNFHGRDRILTLDAFASTRRTDAYDANTASFIVNYERVSTLLFQKPISFGMGLELVATDEQELRTKIAIAPRQTYLVAALPAFAQLDTSDDLLDPTQGFRLRGALSPEVSRQNGVQSFYLKSQVDFSYYRSVTDRVVLASRVRLGSIYGTGLENIAPSRRFYAGGGGSVRGYGYQAIGPRDEVGQPNGGRSVAEFAIEARVRTGWFDNSLSLVPFFDIGSVSRSEVPDFGDLRAGAGIGLRYNTGFGPIRVDVGVPLNRREGDAPVGVYVALGQAF